MFIISRLAGVFVPAGLMWVACTGMAQPPSKPDPADNDQAVVSSKVVHGTAGTSVNFRKAFMLPYPSLITLGGRIDAARRAPDPVALANTAHELSVAEKVSGKEAALTSGAVLKEAAQLAKLRRKVAELRAVAHMAKEIQAEDNLVADIQDDIRNAEATAKAQKRAAAANEEPTWQPRRITVNNYTTQYLTVYVNGTLKCEVGPGLQQTIVIEHRWNPTALTAYGDQDIDSWGRTIWGRFKSYTWNLN